MTEIKIITEPTIVVLAEMTLNGNGLHALVQWVSDAAPACCLPDDWEDKLEGEGPFALVFPHDCHRDEVETHVTDNELLAELAGRKCYNSFGQKAGKNTNASYLSNTMGGPGKISHNSIMYHAKMSFFFAGISRRMSHELIRHYVGADRSQEGAPSQESTRYTEHPGHFIAHPRMLSGFEGLEQVDMGFETRMREAYVGYLQYLNNEVLAFMTMHGKEPKGMDRKRIYEAAAMLLPGAAATSMIWTTNPVALAKLFQERTDEAADLEFQRFAVKLRDICYKRWPNLFRESNPAAGKL